MAIFDSYLYVYQRVYDDPSHVPDHRHPKVIPQSSPPMTTMTTSLKPVWRSCSLDSSNARATAGAAGLYQLWNQQPRRGWDWAASPVGISRIPYF